MAIDWFTVFTGLWGLAAGPAGFWLGRIDRQRDATPNIRTIDFKAGTKGFSGVIEIQARTSEDLIISRINAAGAVSLDGEATAEYDDGGSLLLHQWIFAPVPRTISRLVPGNGALSIKVRVDSLDHFRIDLTISSSARTLADKVISVLALQPE